VVEAVKNGNSNTDVEGNAEGNVLDVLAAVASRKLRVERLQAFGVDGGNPKDYVGILGYVSNRENFERDVMEQWGGGVYVVAGRDSAGKVITAEIRLPGDSRAVDEEDDEPPVRQQSHFRPPFGPPPAYQQQHGPGPVRTWSQDAYWPETQREVIGLRDKLRDLEIKHHAKELECETLKREVDHAKELGREERLKREFNEKLAAITASQPKQDPIASYMPMILKFFELQSQERAARAGKDETAITENARQQQAFFSTLLQQQQQNFQAAMTAKSGSSDLLTAFKTLKDLQGSPLEQFKLMKETAELFGMNGDDEDDDEEEEGSVIEEAIKALPRLMQHGFTAPVAQPAQQQQQHQQLPQGVVALPQPAPVNRINGNGHVAAERKEEADMGPAAWAQILGEVLGYYGQGMPPEQAARHVESYCRSSGVPQAIPILASESPASIVAKVEPVLSQLPAGFPIAGTLKKVVEMLKSPAGATWATTLISRLPVQA